MAEWILLLSQQLLKLSNVCSHTCAKTPTPLIICIVNDALVHPPILHLASSESDVGLEEGEY